MSQAKISKPEVAYSLYTQAEQQLKEAIEKNSTNTAQLQQQLQQAQADKIALSAQYALIRKVNEKVDEFVANSNKVAEVAAPAV